jgi:putative tricarboxylic transport membrane protein
MLDALVSLVSTPSIFVWMFAAVPIGLFFGAVPGLGGKIALIAVIPFIFSMDVLAGCVFLISLHAVVHTGAAVPTILLGIPGTGPSTAVVMDGHAMTRNGEATRALTAAAASSAIGGVLGAAFLAALIPVALGVMKLISYPEIFFLTLFGIIFSALLSGDALVKGLLTGCLGLVLAFVGIEMVFGTHRFIFDHVFLWDGVDLIAAVLALFAIPEMIDLGRTGNPVVPEQTARDRTDRANVRAGLRDIVEHRWLVLRTSFLGAIIGIIPGLGGDVAVWLCYGHAAQTSKHPERFGKGAVEGVIGPEAANNSKEGGALIPTLFLGIPGSSGMAIFLIALVPLGVAPGPNLIVENPEIIWIMVWALVFSNILAALILLLLSSRLHFLGRLNSKIVIPYIYLLSLLSVYISTTEWRFFLFMAVLAIVGYAFKRQGWPRAPFVIGLILGPATETALVKSVSIWGSTFFLRPASFIIIGAMLISLVSVSKKLMKKSRTVSEKTHEES